MCPSNPGITFEEEGLQESINLLNRGKGKWASFNCFISKRIKLLQGKTHSHRSSVTRYVRGWPLSCSLRLVKKKKIPKGSMSYLLRRGTALAIDLTRNPKLETLTHWAESCSFSHSMQYFKTRALCPSLYNEHGPCHGQVHFLHVLHFTTVDNL